MKVGVIGGAALAKLSGEDFDDGLDETRTTFTAGVLLQFPLGAVLTFQPEVHYSNKGTKGVEAGVDIEGKSVYIDVPLLLRGGTMLGERAGIDLLVGPYIGIPIGCRIEAGSGSGSVEEDCEVFDPELELAVDWGVILGGGLTLNLGRADLLLDGRFQLGLTNVFQDEDGMNRNIQILAGLAFPMGR